MQVIRRIKRSKLPAVSSTVLARCVWLPLWPDDCVPPGLPCPWDFQGQEYRTAGISSQYFPQPRGSNWVSCTGGLLTTEPCTVSVTTKRDRTHPQNPHWTRLGEVLALHSSSSCHHVHDTDKEPGTRTVASYHLKTENWENPSRTCGSSSFSVINRRALVQGPLETDFCESRTKYNRANKWDSAPLSLGSRRNNDFKEFCHLGCSLLAFPSPVFFSLSGFSPLILWDVRICWSMIYTLYVLFVNRRW